MFLTVFLFLSRLLILDLLYFISPTKSDLLLILYFMHLISLDKSDLFNDESYNDGSES